MTHRPPSWLPPPTASTLRINEVHVWRVTSGLALPHIQELERLLSSCERERAARFYFRADRDQFIVARGSLRSVLGHYLGQDPKALMFSHGKYGKPALASKSGWHPIRFNVAHSSGLILHAIARDREVGIDVERMRSDFSIQEIATHFFSPEEYVALRALPLEKQCEGFFACWTRKEAYMKATGYGISLPLDSFAVTFVPGEPPALIKAKDGPGELNRWSMIELSPGPEFAAALTVQGRDWQLTCSDYSLETL